MNFYYHETQLNKDELNRQLLLPIKEELKIATETRMDCLEEERKAKKAASRLHSNKNAKKLVETKKKRTYLARRKETMLKFELRRTTQFHQYNSIWAIKIDSQDPADQKTWKYNVVFESSDGCFYEALVAKIRLMQNLDPLYIEDLKKHHHSKNYILYDDFGPIISENWTPSDFIPRHNGKPKKQIYKYNITNDDCIVKLVRILATFSENTQKPYYIDSYAIYYEDEKSEEKTNDDQSDNEHKYAYCTEEEFENIVDDVF